MSRMKGSKNKQSNMLELSSKEPKDRLELLASIIAERIALDYLGERRLLKNLSGKHYGSQS